MKPIYNGRFAKTKYKGVVELFKLPERDEDFNIIFASHLTPEDTNSEYGTAIIIFEENKQFYFVTALEMETYPFDKQWHPMRFELTRLFNKIHLEVKHTEKFNSIKIKNEKNKLLKCLYNLIYEVMYEDTVS